MLKRSKAFVFIILNTLHFNVFDPMFGRQEDERSTPIVCGALYNSDDGFAHLGCILGNVVYR